MAALSPVRSDQLVRVSAERVRVSLRAVVAWWLARRLARLVVFLVRTPAVLVPLAVIIFAVVVWHAVHPAVVLSVAGVLLASMIVWRLRWPVSFDARIACRSRAGWRSAWVYRRCWTIGMDTAGLTITRNGAEYVPPLLTVTSTRSVDRVRVRMLPGQTIDDYAAASPRLAQTFGAADCRVRSISRRPHQADLCFLTRDPLLAPVPPFPVCPDVLTLGVPVAMAEDGTKVRVQLVGHHLLVVGATGAGKGSVIWSLLLGLQDVIRAGLVTVWALDPKGGMELAGGRHLFARFAHGDSASGAAWEASFAAVLEDAVQVMRSRQDRLRGVTRLHQPSQAEPLIVIVVDELAALPGWVTDRGVKGRIAAALGLVLSQGRAVGVIIVGAVQDPRKDVLPLRDLFPTRVGLRLNEAEQVGLVFGPGARNRGATCDLIPDTLPGVGYLQLEGAAEPVRVRFSHITDTHITDSRALPVTGPVLDVIDGGLAE